MAIRKKLGNDPLARRPHETAAGPVLPVIPAPVQALAATPPLAAAEPQNERKSLGRDLAALFPVPHCSTAACRKDLPRDERWRYILEEQFRRLALSLPTVFGRPTFTADQFADALALTVREALPTDTGALRPSMDAPALTIPRQTALILLYGCLGALQTLAADGKSQDAPALAIHLEPIAHSGEFMLRMTEASSEKEDGQSRRLLDRDRIWPALQALGLALARRGCRLFLFTARHTELRIIAPALLPVRRAA